MLKFTRSIICSILCVLMLVFIMGCSAPPVAVVTSTPIPVPIATQQPVATVNVVPDDSQTVTDVLTILRSGMTSAIVSVDTVNKVFIIIPTDSSIPQILVSAYQGDSTALANWNELVISLCGLSVSIADNLPNYSLEFINPSNVGKVLLVVSNGTIIYNFLSDTTPVANTNQNVTQV